MRGFSVLFATEAKVALRGMDMVLFGVAFPLAIMLLVGSISGRASVPSSFAGIACVGLCASGLMGIPLTFASYRHEKILRRFRVTPVSPASLLLAVALTQVLFAWVSALGVFLVARLAFGMVLAGSPGRIIAVFVFVQVSVYSIGFLIASLAPDMKRANLACTIAYFPMLLLSGATVPYDVLPRGVTLFADFFPLTQGISLLRAAVLGVQTGNSTVAVLALGALAAVSYAVSLATFRWE